MHLLIEVRPRLGIRWSCVPWLIICLLFLPLLARADLWIAGYYPGYETGQMAPSNIDFTTVTHVIHFSLVPQSDGSLDSEANGLTPSACNTLVGLAHAAGKKALVCVGGAGTEDDFLDAASSNLQGFISNLVNFMSAYHYDGIDLDWEPFLSS